MKTLIEDLKKVITSNIENKDKWCERLINDFIKEKQTEQLPIYCVVSTLLCVDALDHWEITKGKKYQMLEESEFHFRIINDLGKPESYHKDWLKKIN
jgi:hypothetical protein